MLALIFVLGALAAFIVEAALGFAALVPLALAGALLVLAGLAALGVTEPAVLIVAGGLLTLLFTLLARRFIANHGTRGLREDINVYERVKEDFGASSSKAEDPGALHDKA